MRLLGSNVPLFSGLPPLRKMIMPTEDPDWRDRLRAALAAADQATGGSYSIWYVEYARPAGTFPGSIAEVVCERHRKTEQFFREDAFTATVTRYVPGRDGPGPGSLSPRTQPGS